MKKSQYKQPARLGPTPRMKVRYRDEIVPALMKEFGYSNVMQVPRIAKISVNIGLARRLQNSKALEAAAGDMAIVTGQKAVITKAKKSIAHLQAARRDADRRR